MKQKKYVLKITLNEIKPAIWRRFVVPADISLDRLHDVIQTVMGWFDYHLHEFIIGGKSYTEDPESPDDGEQDGLFRLCDLVKRQGTEFEYIYDFGDRWQHQIVVEKTNFIPENQEASITCLDGARNCPPEDIGGVPGYIGFCEAVSDKNHPRHAEYKEWYAELDWYDGTFNCEHFNRGRTNLELLKYLHWSRHRLIPWAVRY